MAAFFNLRLIRLHPLVVIGSVIGLLAFVFDPFSNLYQTYSGKLVPMFLTSALMIPYPIVRERYFNLFHLNPPAWSLFWEYIANICYALFLVRFNNKILWVLVAIGAIALFNEAHQSGNLGVGWSGDNIGGGGIRVFYSFIAGMLVYRSGWVIKSYAGFIGVGVLLVAAFLIPFSKALNPIVEPLVIIFYFPLLVALGAGAQSSGIVNRLCNFSGDISYPLYMVHYPFIWLFMSYVEKAKPTIGHMTCIIIIGTLLLILFAYTIMILIDIPIRRYFKRLMQGV